MERLSRKELKAIIRNQTCRNCIHMRYVPSTFSASQEAMDNFHMGEKAYGKLKIECVCNVEDTEKLIPEERTCKKWEKAIDIVYSDYIPVVDENDNTEITEKLLAWMHSVKTW